MVRDGQRLAGAPRRPCRPLSRSTPRAIALFPVWNSPAGTSGRRRGPYARIRFGAYHVSLMTSPRPCPAPGLKPVLPSITLPGLADVSQPLLAALQGAEDGRGYAVQAHAGRLMLRFLTAFPPPQQGGASRSSIRSDLGENFAAYNAPGRLRRAACDQSHLDRVHHIEPAAWRT